MAIEKQMSSIEFYKTTVSFIGSEEETVLSYGTTQERFSRIKEWVNEMIASKSLIAYLREAIKAKDRLKQDLNDYGADEINKFAVAGHILHQGTEPLS